MNLLIQKRMPWRKHLIQLMCTGIVTVGVIGYLSHRYRLGYDNQFDRCIPEYRVYLIDTYDMRPVRKGYYAFYSQGLSPIYSDGQLMLKQLTGLPGDTVSVSANGVAINDQTIAMTLSLAERLGVDESVFMRELTLLDEQYWLSGTSETSFDSRYWGAVEVSQLIGRAWPLW